MSEENGCEVMETIDEIVREMRIIGSVEEKSTDQILSSFQSHGLRMFADRIEAAWQREHSQTETSVRYEYALQEKFRGVWRVDLMGFSSLDEAEDYINMMCEINPDREFRIVRRPAEWEVVE